MGWIGVDLDETLAYGGGNDSHIGEPVPLMAERVRNWLAEGRDVRIFTARACGQYSHAESEQERFRKLLPMIQDWTEKHFGVRLPVTCLKDWDMDEIWDNKAVGIIADTGQIGSRG